LPNDQGTTIVRISRRTYEVTIPAPKNQGERILAAERRGDERREKAWAAFRQAEINRQREAANAAHDAAVTASLLKKDQNGVRESAAVLLNVFSQMLERIQSGSRFRFDRATLRAIERHRDEIHTLIFNAPLSPAARTFEGANVVALPV
jgi:hypothetical protein